MRDPKEVGKAGAPSESVENDDQPIGGGERLSKKRKSHQDLTDAELQIKSKSLAEAKAREHEIALALLQSQATTSDLLKLKYTNDPQQPQLDPQLDTDLDNSLIVNQNLIANLRNARLEVKNAQLEVKNAQFEVKNARLEVTYLSSIPSQSAEAQPASQSAEAQPALPKLTPEQIQRRKEIQSASRSRTRDLAFTASEQQLQDRERMEIMQKIKLALIEKPNLKKFLEEKEVYKKLEFWLKGIITFNHREKKGGTINFIDASEENIQKAVNEFYSKEDASPREKTIFSNILRRGKDFINEILASAGTSADYENDMKFLENILLKLIKYPRQINVGDAKTKPTEIIQHFLDSNIKLKANQYNIEIVIKNKRSNLLERYIKDDPEFFRQQKESGTSDFLHRAIRQDNAKIVLSFLLLGFDTNAENTYGDRPLHSFGNTKTLGGILIITQMLLTFGADPSIKNSRDKLPADLFLALKKTHLQDTINLMTDVSNFIRQQEDLPSSSSQISGAIQNEGISGEERIATSSPSSPAGSKLERVPSPILNFIISGDEPDPLSPAGASRPQDGRGSR